MQGEESKTASLHMSFILLLLIKYLIFPKSCNKRYKFIVKGVNNLEIVFTLLTKVVAVYMQIIIIEIGDPRFERSIKIIFNLKAIAISPKVTRTLILLMNIYINWLESLTYRILKTGIDAGLKGIKPRVIELREPKSRKSLMVDFL